MSQDAIRERTLAIARGEFKPYIDEPKIWFSSMESLASTLSDENRTLLQTIYNHKPTSIAALADISGTNANNLLRSLKKMESYGFVSLEKENNEICPIAKAIEFHIFISERTI